LIIVQTNNLDSYQPESPSKFTAQQEGAAEASKSQNFAVTSQNHQIIALATAQAHQQGSEGQHLNQNHHLMAPSSHQPIPIGMNLNPSNPNPSSFLQQNFQQASNSQGPSPSSEDANIAKNQDNMVDNEAEGVWSPDIEISFQEALTIYPPCGRRKIILSDEGKMYGRNELIARYIKIRTGKVRTRKQVSSHIQVLARRKSREMQSQFKANLNSRVDQATKDKVLQSMASMSSAQIVSAGALSQLPNNRIDMNQPLTYKHSMWPNVSNQNNNELKGFPHGVQGYIGMNSPSQQHQIHQIPSASSIAPSIVLKQDAIQNNSSTLLLQHQAKPDDVEGSGFLKNQLIAGTDMKLINFTAYRELENGADSLSSKHSFVNIDQSNQDEPPPNMEIIQISKIEDKFPGSDENPGLKEMFYKRSNEPFFLIKFWADLGCDWDDAVAQSFVFASKYESKENLEIKVSTQVCSFGKQVVEKIETLKGRLVNNRYVYNFNKSKMCEYMVNFILRLKLLPEREMKNNVLENFSILHTVKNDKTGELLLCIAFIFSISQAGPQHVAYKLVGNDANHLQ